MSLHRVVFLGPTGVGKTHLAIALGILAIRQGYRVLFTTLDQLVELVDRAVTTDSVRRITTAFMRPDLLILDEMDLYGLSTSSSSFLNVLPRGRHETNSVIFTSNKKPSEWEPLFAGQGEKVLDRIFEHCTLMNIDGDSYRTKGKLLV